MRVTAAQLRAKFVDDLFALFAAHEGAPAESDGELLDGVVRLMDEFEEAGGRGKPVDPDLLYRRRRDELVPDAERYADALFDRKLPDQRRKWQRVFLRRMTELSVDAGLVSPNSLLLCRGGVGDG